MDNKIKDRLGVRALSRLIVLSAITGLFLFVPAATIRYWEAWVYLAIFFGASLLMSLYLLKRDPALLRRRMKGGPAFEKEPVQKIIMLCALIGFIALLVVPALDHRFGWSAISVFPIIAGDLSVAIGMALIFLVYRENTFASATIEVTENQAVISTGPYARVRHPMYASTVLICLGSPLALGSYWGLGMLAFLAPFLIWRLLDEERFLAKNLPGYIEYQQRVRYRLIPFLW